MRPTVRRFAALAAIAALVFTPATGSAAHPVKIHRAALQLRQVVGGLSSAEVSGTALRRALYSAGLTPQHDGMRALISSIRNGTTPPKTLELLTASPLTAEAIEALSKGVGTTAATVSTCGPLCDLGALNLEINAAAQRAALGDQGFQRLLRMQNETLPTPLQLGQDAQVAEALVRRQAPNGFVSVFGSARKGPGTDAYVLADDFASLWTRETGGTVPIMSGVGPGVMEGANKGAAEAGGKSLGIGARFGEGTAEQTANEFATAARILSDFPVRQRGLIVYSNGLTAVQGGVGTSSELFQSLAEIQKGTMRPVPVLLLGRDWEGIQPVLDDMVRLGGITAEQRAMIKQARTAREGVDILKAHIAANPIRNFAALRNMPARTLATPVQVANDALQVEATIRATSPNGVITFFGHPETLTGDAETLARLVVERTGGRYAIASAGTPGGIQAAAARGARGAGGTTIGFPLKNLETAGADLTHPVPLDDVTVRTRALIKYSQSIIVYPGDYETAWSLFHSISEIQTGKLRKIPIILMGPKSQWRGVESYLQSLADVGTIAREDVHLVKYATTEADALAIIQRHLDTLSP